MAGQDEGDTHALGLLVDLLVQRASGLGPLRELRELRKGFSGVYSRTSRNSRTIASF